MTQQAFGCRQLLFEQTKSYIHVIPSVAQPKVLYVFFEEGLKGRGAPSCRLQALHSNIWGT